jgi:hypothetical protein
LETNVGESAAISILPTTRWDDIQPQRSYLDELTSNPSIRRVCPDVDRIARDVRSKAEELQFVDAAEPLVAAIDNADGLHAVVAYTHDLQHGRKEGNFYFEQNWQLRDRSPAGRKQLHETWGVPVHYLLKALHRLPNFAGICYRGFPSTDRDVILQQYKKGRPIQWGAFTSTTTNVEAARGFAGVGGVVIKIDVTDGKDICPLSFFATEMEILLSPNHKFFVTSETGGYTDDAGYTVVELLQQEGAFLIS